jgi:hypothetical protein
LAEELPRFSCSLKKSWSVAAIELIAACAAKTSAEVVFDSIPWAWIAALLRADRTWRPWREHVALAAMSVIEQEVRNAADGRSAVS